jgi:hypothetical protein
MGYHHDSGRGGVQHYPATEPDHPCVWLVGRLAVSHVAEKRLRVHATGVHVDDLWLVELTTIADSEVNMNIDGAIKEHLGVASMLAPYVTLNCPDENGANAGQHMRL